MTSNLRPFQEELRQRLIAEPGPRRLLVRAPAGSGIQSILVSVVATEIRAGGRVAIIASRRILLDQWTKMLRDAGVERISQLQRGSDALVVLDDPAKGESGVTMATIQLLSHGLGGRAAENLVPTLLVIDVDGMSQGSRAEQVLNSLVERSRKAVVVSSSASELGWFTPDVTEDISLTESIGLRPPNSVVLVAKYPLDPAEAELISRTKALLYPADATPPLHVPNSRPALHAMLIRRLSHVSDDPSAESGDEVPDLEDQRTASIPVQPPEELWSLLDDIEALDVDPRMQVTAELVQQSLRAGRPALVVTDHAIDAEYVAGGLRESDIPAIAITGSSPSTERDTAIEKLGPGAAVVVTRAIQESVDLPPETDEVWWSPPRTLNEAVRRLTMSADNGRVTVLLADPPTSEDERVLDLLEELRALGVDHHAAPDH